MRLSLRIGSEPVGDIGYRETRPTHKMHPPRKWGAPVAVAAVLAGTLAGWPTVGAASSTLPKLFAVGAENEYANVVSQIGGRYVTTAAVMSNPNTDPHEFEANAAVAAEVARARLVVQNGMGYDTFMDKIEAASPDKHRLVVVAQEVAGFKAHAFNPHLWYDPKTMPAVAKAVAADLEKLEPAHASYFRANLRRFELSLRPWLAAIARFRSRYRGTPVAVTEPVADYMLEAAGADIKTPDALQAAIMNGTDPSPQDVALEERLLKKREVKVFLYNRQVTDTFTASLLSLAKKSKVPVVGVYETMPVPGYDYQSWMLAEVEALTRAVASGKSTFSL